MEATSVDCYDAYSADFDWKFIRSFRLNRKDFFMQALPISLIFWQRSFLNPGLYL
jgi:hypothetical protein